VGNSSLPRRIRSRWRIAWLGGVTWGRSITRRRCNNPALVRHMAASETSESTLFREEAERARRYAAAMSDKKVIDRLNEIAGLYDELAPGQDPGSTDRD
jgi:hypothetical protein